jgi:uncharacterized protein (DUF58 family)
LIRKFYLSLFFSRRFYRVFAGIIVGFVLSYGLPPLFSVSLIALAIFGALTLLDYFILFRLREPVEIARVMPDTLSNGDRNKVDLRVLNLYPFHTELRIIDELPDQLQVRNFSLTENFKPGERRELYYEVRPTLRGEYVFHRINTFIKSPLKLVVRRKVIPSERTVKVLPSFVLLRQFEFLAHFSNQGGANLKKVRRTGHSLEFEQIREYVAGDDIRSINWKATGRSGGQLMINSYTDEKSQQVYCVIDKGRVMKMPFNGISLLDYAINASLIMAGVALAKQDKTGLITFAERTGDFLPANHRSVQMMNILNTLYNQQTRFNETNYEPLHGLIKTRLSQRSLLILFTNFESMAALNRQLGYLRSISRKHLLLVVFFENTPLAELANREADTMEALYEKVIAEKFILEKKLIVKELQRYGIHALLTAPEKLTVNVVNKYLEIKERREI